MTTQTETIVWHKYPEEEPEMGKHLVSIEYGCHGKRVNSITTAIFDLVMLGDPLERKWVIDNKDAIVLAWAELPKGWR